MNNGKKNETNTMIVTTSLFVATFLSAIEGTIVSTAMPTIVGELHGVSLMNWVFSIYLLTSSIATPIYGKLSDLLGRKRVLVAGLSVFIVGSLLSGITSSMEALIVWRALQGLGAGVILPVSYAMIADIYPFAKRSKIIGLNSAGWGISAVIAPLLGGFIVDTLGWRWIFLINIPIGLITMGLIIYYFKETMVTRKRVSIDYLGTIYLTVVLLSLMLMIQILGDKSVGLSRLAFLFLICFASIVLFIRREHSFIDPIIPMGMFKHGSFVAQNAVAFFISGFVMCIEVYVPNWIQGIKGFKASIAGLALTPSSVLWVLGSFASGWLITKIHSKYVTTVGIGFVLLGSIIFVLANQTLSLSWFFITTALSGFGFGIVMTNTTVIVQQKVSDYDVGAATSFNVLCRTLGQTLFIAIFGIFMNTSLRVGVLQIDGASIKKVNKLMSPETAVLLPAKLIPSLKTILFNALHNVFVVGMVVVMIALIINLSYHHLKKDEA
ncbi:MDR family MFS transporter [Nicoliella lavandulae]|uniref:MDR family MFS transporter n=1 Tax=Nicoliella lavandulae TaxID=3082954 RepID=A0ABU8SLK2_9LACO